MVSDQQVKRLWRLVRTELTLEVAAAKAGMDAKSARKYLRDRRLPSEMKQKHNWRTRPDPFAAVWEEIRQRLEVEPGLQAKTIFEHLQRTEAGRFADGQLRTLQRRIKQWRATDGPAKEVFFAQQHQPGELCQSDFTHCRELGVTIAGEEFPHLIYHFVLSYSNWETGSVCYSESFESLSEGLQKALWELGGVPREHRSDRMSAAVNNLTDRKEFTCAYEALLAHYKLAGQKIQAGRANENGDIEQRHYRFKQAVTQGLMMRGSRDFASVADYEDYLRKFFARLNAGRRARLAEEMRVLRPLPERRLDTTRRMKVRVSPGSLISVHRNTYSVHSRLIGELVEVRLKPDTVEVWYGDRRVEELPRLRGRGKHRVDYRHIIDWLVRKPGAFENYRYREELFPTSWFRMSYDALREQWGPRRGAKEYIQMLALAARRGESLVEETLRVLLKESGLSATAVGQMLEGTIPRTPITAVEVEPVSLAVFDELLTGDEVAA
ncbi:MAG TPA: IS21 family transposase [Bryobacteraceae bacterium]|nr:IS21 family transposase [Bryobacteraceae bacterium]